ncbi:helix-turn-helix transcriptional regulator [Mucilaginibacter sp. SP1R1]|uniref:helix-turn-helix transcriptional regulator n=1 Tax=Mucilaginibacter sp. SP1R1 TaxID=2723091 RepID=UPI0016186963|nr:hypothetical protein [Mucilaginibacter sp. SP1R1]MBB6148323.1 DNA-binding CsgD family transcriptional regulator [Mucilaginibacter sp. SP1R1]
MTVTYTRILGRKILLAFLIFIILFSVTTFFIRHVILRKLADVTKMTSSIPYHQSKPGKVLLLLHQADDDFQESLLNVNNKNFSDYKTKLAVVFNEINTLLKDRADTAHLTRAQNNQIKWWYKRKLALSDQLFELKHSFDSLLTVYADFHHNGHGAVHPFDTNLYVNKEVIKNNVDTTQKKIQRKGLLGRLKDAISNKGQGAIIEISHDKRIQTTDLNTHKIVTEDRNAYLHKLQQLQQQNVKLLHMQKELLSLNTHILNKLENIINEARDINYQMSDGFKEMALKSYEETTALLNKFYLTDLLLVLIFALSLIIFIVQLNRSELRLRMENEQSMIRAQQEIDQLIKKIVPDHNQSVLKAKILEEIVHLAVNNNPAFLIKFNEYDGEFIGKLLSKSPTLTALEIEFCVQLRLNFETKEIARYTKTSVRSVEGKKYRIRKKLDIPSDQDINIWMTNY